MDLYQLLEVGGTVTSVSVLIAWVMAERNDNRELWSIIDSLVKLRLKQLEDNRDAVLMEND